MVAGLSFIREVPGAGVVQGTVVRLVSYSTWIVEELVIVEVKSVTDLQRLKPRSLPIWG